jgi:hypothetical protein
MPSYIELDKQGSFPASSNSGKVILGINSNNQLQLTNNSGQSVAAAGLPYQVYTALVTQSGGNSPLTTGNINGGPPKDSDGFIIGVSYEINANPNNTDLSLYGAPNNSVGTKFVSIYSGNLSDDGIDVEVIFSFNEGAPRVTVLDNTLGNIWFEYIDVGKFYIKSDGLFTQGNTYIAPQICGEDEYAPLIGVVKYETNSQVYLYAMNSNGAAYHGPISPSFNLYSSIEIRIYN